MRPEDEHVRSEHRAECDAGVRRRRQPAESLGALLGLERVGDVGLDHAHRSAARALHEARQEQQPQRVRVREDHVRDRRRGQARPSAPAGGRTVGEPAPHRRADQLRDGERRHEQPDDEPVRAERLGVEREEGE